MLVKQQGERGEVCGFLESFKDTPVSWSASPPGKTRNTSTCIKIIFGDRPQKSISAMWEFNGWQPLNIMHTQTMNRLDRLTSILIQLQSKRLTTAREIAERFEVTIRTIYRDIQTLRLAGVPIGEEEGKGYFLVEGYRLPPVMFTTEEARALLTTSKILNYHSEDSLKQHYESALLKIKAVLSPKNKDKLEFLNSRIGFQKPWAPVSLYLDSIQHSITESEKLKIKYQSRNEEQLTERIIHPYAVYFSGAVWTTIAFCELRQEIREFRLDRIKEFKIQQTHFEPDKSFGLERYLEERSKRLF